MDKPRVVVASETPVLLKGISRLLSEDRRLAVVARTTDLQSAMAMASQSTCDILVVHTPSPLRTTARLFERRSASASGVSVLLLVDQITRDELLAVLRAGVFGYAVLRDLTPAQLCNGVAALARDGFWFGPTATRLLIAEALSHSTETEGPVLPFPAAQPSNHPQLSGRELDVLRLAASGEGETQIAHDLSVTPSSVKTYLRRIRLKLETTSRAESIRLGIQLGLVQDRLTTSAGQPSARTNHGRLGGRHVVATRALH